MAQQDKRPFDIIVWGATGYTGGLVVDYLNANASQSLSWAIAGRNKTKLEQIKSKLSKDVGLFVAESEFQYQDITKLTKTLIATAGPFLVVGEGMVKACIATRTHYVDCTGEPSWVYEMIEKYGVAAQASKTMIVSFCGFDCVPSDMGTFMVVDHIRGTMRKDVGEVKAYIGPVKGGASGGTLNTVFTTFEKADMKSLRKASQPYGLNPPGKIPATTAFDKDQRLGKWNDEMHKWTIPWIMATVNLRCVRRSAALADYGPYFHYNEALLTKSWMYALVFPVLLLLFVVLAFLRPTRWLLRKFITQPGQGPALASRQKCHYTYTIIARTAEPRPRKVVGTLTGKDAYEDTAMMLVQCAMCIVENFDELPGKQGGFLTPASAFGATLLQRLRGTGMNLAITDDGGPLSPQPTSPSKNQLRQSL
eukprot:TRINITY_DN12497_c0_g2_i2.p1 TRINITY_DN12497_c0_g2~~TRINITY_DN12497_c0_g2_i2.p1  ORF type:complete len:433 (-),score=86.10 TRINITY_DN12497_c0_g2_i2:1021-2283(-)